MKRFEKYQYVEGESMSEEDKQKNVSKFWNKGKWDNFVLPFLPEDCSEKVFADIGCNAGLFLKLAEDKGFNRVIGVDSNKIAYNRAVAYKERNGGRYDIRLQYMQKSLEDLPLTDYVVLANSHYYFNIEQWINYIDELQKKTCYCIIVTAHDEHNTLSKPSPLVVDIRRYMENWDEIGIIKNVSIENDPVPRNLRSLCFKSRIINRIPIDILCNAYKVKDDIYYKTQKDFFTQLDNGVSVFETDYYKYYTDIKMVKIKYIRRGISAKMELYKSIKANGLINPIIVNSDNKILEGNHRYTILKHLGYKTIIVRQT